jgi:hypothetical protein
MLYKLLGWFIWRSVVWVLRQRYGRLMAPKPLAAVGIVLVALGAAAAARQVASGEDE